MQQFNSRNKQTHPVAPSSHSLPCIHQVLSCRYIGGSGMLGYSNGNATHGQYRTQLTQKTDAAIIIWRSVPSSPDVLVQQNLCKMCDTQKLFWCENPISLSNSNIVFFSSQQSWFKKYELRHCRKLGYDLLATPGFWKRLLMQPLPYDTKATFFHKIHVNSLSASQGRCPRPVPTVCWGAFTHPPGPQHHCNTVRLVEYSL